MSHTWVFATLGLAVFLLAGAAEDEGRRLFLEVQNAVGGAKRIGAVRDFEQFEKADTWFPDGRPRGEVRKRVRFIRPSYLRVDQVGPGDTYVLYFDGKSGWEITPEGKVVDLSGGELRFAQGYVGGLSINRWLIDQDPDVVFTSSSPNTITVATKGDPKHQTVITVDPLTHLEVKSTGISLADPDHPVSSETSVENWHSVDGLKFPGRIINIHGGAKLADISVQSTKLDRGREPPTWPANRRTTSRSCRGSKRAASKRVAQAFMPAPRPLKKPASAASAPNQIISPSLSHTVGDGHRHSGGGEANAFSVEYQPFTAIDGCCRANHEKNAKS